MNHVDTKAMGIPWCEVQSRIIGLSMGHAATGTILVWVHCVLHGEHYDIRLELLLRIIYGSVVLLKSEFGV